MNGGDAPVIYPCWEANISPYQCIFEDECPFFEVGYGSSLQGMESSG